MKKLGKRVADEAFLIEPAMDRLRKARLRVTMSRLAVLQALHADPEKWFHIELLYTRLLARGVQANLSTLYRVMNEMVEHGLLLRQVNDSGKRFFRYRQGRHCLHRIVCHDTGRELAVTDDISLEHLADILRSQGLILADDPVTVHVRCCQALNSSH